MCPIQAGERSPDSNKFVLVGVSGTPVDSINIFSFSVGIRLLVA